MKSRFIAFDESSLMLRAVGQLKSRAWHARPLHAAVQLRSDPGSLVTSRSISGAATHLSALPRDSPLMPPRRRQKLLIILQPRDDSLLTVCWLEHDVYEKLPIMPKSASDITKKIYKSARRSCASTPRPFAAVGGGTVSGLVGCGVASVWKSGSL